MYYQAVNVYLETRQGCYTFIVQLQLFLPLEKLIVFLLALLVDGSLQHPLGHVFLGELLDDEYFLFEVHVLLPN